MNSRMHGRCLRTLVIAFLVLASGAGVTWAADSPKQVADKFIKCMWDGNYREMYDLLSERMKKSSGTIEEWVASMKSEFGSGGIKKIGDYMLEKDADFKEMKGTPEFRLLSAFMKLFMAELKMEIGKVEENGDKATAEVILSAPDPDNLTEEQNAALREKMEKLMARVSASDITDADLNKELVALLKEFPIGNETESINLLKENGKWVVDDDNMMGGFKNLKF